MIVTMVLVCVCVPLGFIEGLRRQDDGDQGILIIGLLGLVSILTSAAGA